jgi:S-DNA-T family DNA segregation ATPase FtsK/SpoIIIE
VLALLLKTNPGRIILLIVLAGAAVAVWLQPSWVSDPSRDLAERTLENFGGGSISVGLWAFALLAVWRYRFSLLFHKWRWVLGSGVLVLAVQGILAYYQAMLPLIGYNNLGGEYGLRIQGDSTPISYVRVGGIALLGLWILAPQRTVGPAILRLAYTLGLLVRGLLIVLSLPRRLRLRAPFGTARQVIKHIKETRPGRESADLADELGDYLAATHQESALDRPSERPRTLTSDALLSPAPAPTVIVAEPVRASSPKAPKESQEASGQWNLPPANLLAPAAAVLEAGEEHTATARLIEETLGQHSVEVRVAEIRPGPVVTMFGLVPGWNRRRGSAQTSTLKNNEFEATTRNRVKVDSILAREKDLALALAAPSLRIQAPVPGEPVVGVEVPNRIASTVSIRTVMESDSYQSILDRGGLPIALGQASAGEPVAIDLLTMPHLLIAGATGSGKSVCINSVVASIISHQQPNAVRLMMVDPKRVELTPYNAIPHLVTPVAVETDHVVRLLKGAIQEMLRRYQLLEKAGVRNIQSYNRSPKATEAISYLVICIDELADLMMTSAYAVEQYICRLAQLGRATGIHMVIATQRPSVDVVTGLIKANFPSRISFAVASQVDSRTILDTGGAERLLGRGDMLFLSPEDAKPRRVQGVYISEEETEALSSYWQHQKGPPVAGIALEDMADEAMAAEGDLASSGNGQDSFFDKAVELAGRNRQLSISLLQRRLGIGYPRAARLMDQLEDEGIVAPSNQPGKPRDVLYRPAESS